MPACRRHRASQLDTFWGEGDPPAIQRALQVVQGKAMWIAYIHHILPTNSAQLSHQKAEEGTENKGNFISSKVRKMAKNGNGTKRKHAIVRDQTQFSDSESYKI